MKTLFPQIDFFKNVVWSIKKGFPYKLLFISTFSCNSRCITCDNWKIGSENELDTGEIKKIFSAIPFRISWLSITGGEPSLRNDLVDIVDLALDSFPSLQMVSLISNGIFKEKVVSDVKKIMERKIPFLFLRLSIDGPEHIHNKIRNIPDAYRKTMETYEELNKITCHHQEINLGIEITLSSANMDHLNEFLPNLLKKYTVNISIAHRGYLYHNMGHDDPVYKMEGDRVKRIIKYQYRKLSYFKVSHLMQKLYLSSLPAYLENRNTVAGNCVALRSSFGIDPYGNVIPCLMWGRTLGNLREVGYDFMKLWDSPVRATVLKEIDEKKCILCWTPCEAYQKILNDLVKRFRIC